VVQGLNVRIVPNAIALEEMNIDFNTNREILFIGRNEKRKNYQLYEQFSLVPTSKKYKFRAITNQNINSENISVYVNPNNEIKDRLLKNSSIYLAVNTHGESFGITIIEAINSGCIAICSDIEPFKELLEESGIYFNNNDLKSLTSAVEDITSRNAIDVYLKQKEHIRKYEIDKVIPSWISLYSQI
jgi:glycosyltransferase involved in cell wall biosynthesis